MSVLVICLLELWAIPSLFIPSLKYGSAMEEPARCAYKMYLIAHSHKNVRVEMAELFVDKCHSFLGASPDGIVSCSLCGIGVLEIKCPFATSN